MSLGQNLLTSEKLFRLGLNLPIVRVPFPGAAPILASTVAGHTLVAYIGLPSAAPHHQGGLAAGAGGDQPKAISDRPRRPDHGRKRSRRPGNRIDHRPRRARRRRRRPWSISSPRQLARIVAAARHPATARGVRLLGGGQHAGGVCRPDQGRYRKVEQKSFAMPASRSSDSVAGSDGSADACGNVCGETSTAAFDPPLAVLAGSRRQAYRSGFNEHRPQSSFVLSQRHLLGIEGLSRDEIVGLLDLAEEFVELNRQIEKKRASLRGRTQINLFFEASTRTQASFELAGKRLGADVMNMSVGSSVHAQGRDADRHRDHAQRHAPRHHRGAPSRLRRGRAAGAARSTAR